jgi:hypothetical protein
MLSIWIFNLLKILVIHYLIVFRPAKSDKFHYETFVEVVYCFFVRNSFVIYEIEQEEERGKLKNSEAEK